MASITDLLQEEADENVVSDDALVNMQGEDFVYSPVTPEEQKLLEEDFPKYSKESRSIISSINDVLQELETESLFATDDKVELTAFEDKLYKLINKE